MNNSETEIPIHNALVFGTSNREITDEEFKDRLENNFRVVDHIQTETSENIIDGINSIVNMLGAFSSRRIGVDEYDRKKYNDYYSDDENENNENIPEENRFCHSLIEGANNEVSYVHNAVGHVRKNQWRHICLNMYYIVNRNIIPNPTHPNYTAINGNQDSSYHDFPRFFKIKRSGGDIQDAKWEYNESIKLHKSRTLNDAHERLYITANYLPDKSIDIHNSDCYDYLFKNIPLDSVLETNPEITEITFRFFIWSDSKIANSPSEIAEVMVHYNTLHHEWREERLIPAIYRLENPLTVKLIYENNSSYNNTLVVVN
jgi:hypothetical protein